MAKNLKVNWRYLGMVDYAEALKLQIQLSRELLHQSALSGYLLFLEHPPTITFGYSLKEEQAKTQLRVKEAVLKNMGIKIFWTDRGGKATYHGPGQLVIYPILNLARFRFSSRRYVDQLLQVVINWLLSKGIPAERDPAFPGVWVRGKKIASVGVRIENQVSRHGIALNLWPDLSYFDLIIPCGIPDCQMTSYFQLTGKKFKIEAGISELLLEFERVFEMKLIADYNGVQSDKGGINDDQGMADARVV